MGARLPPAAVDAQHVLPYGHVERSIRSIDLCSGPRHGDPLGSRPSGAHVSLLDYPSVRAPGPRLDELEDAFRVWTHDPAKPDVVYLGQLGDVPMVELSHRLRGSEATLAEAACAQLGLPPGATIATAVAALLHATDAPDGPRCRSFRAASYYLRGLARLDPDLRSDTVYLDARTDGSRGHAHVR